MKKILFYAVLFFGIAESTLASSTKPTYQEEMYILGAISGEGLACKSQKYHKFELLARALVVSKAANTEMENEGLYQFSEGKVNAFVSVREKGFANCATILEQFDNQKIFNSVLYSDGRIKMYDGTLITPRKPYDASKLYVKDREAFIKMDELYKKSLDKAQKNAQNAKKVPLKDARYDAFAQQFSN